MENAEESGQELSPRQEAALLALLEAGTVRDAAAKCDTSEATLYRFLQEPLFLTRYREARARLVETGIARLQSACGTAVDTLLEIAQDKEAAPTARIAAARAILSQAVRGAEWAAPSDGAASAHEHVCIEGLHRYQCHGKDCGDVEMGRCGEHPKQPRK